MRNRSDVGASGGGDVFANMNQGCLYSPDSQLKVNSMQKCATSVSDWLHIVDNTHVESYWISTVA